MLAVPQEEVGIIGSTVASRKINPDMGIAIDVTNSYDIPCNTDRNVVLGGGAAIKVMDNSVICDEYLVQEMIKCAEINGIKYQLDVLNGGGTDAVAIVRPNEGVKAIGLSIPSRYGHSPMQ